MIRATVDGLKKQASPRQVAQRRGKKVADILKKPEAEAAVSVRSPRHGNHHRQADRLADPPPGQAVAIR